MFKVKSEIAARVINDTRGEPCFIEVGVATAEAYEFVCLVDDEVGNKDSVSQPLRQRKDLKFPNEATIFVSRCYDMIEIAEKLNSWSRSNG